MRRPWRGVVAAVTLAWASPVSAQRLHVGLSRVVVEYDYQSEHAFGGWRAELGWHPTADLAVGASTGYWPNLLRFPSEAQSSGHDGLLELRFAPTGPGRVMLYSILGVGHFRGPDDSIAPGSVISGPDGLAVVAGLGVDVAIIGGLRASLVGLRRDDDGSANYEGRAGLVVGGARGSAVGARRTRVEAGIATATTTLAGNYVGDGFGFTIDLTRSLGPTTDATFGVSALPVTGRTASGQFTVDTSLLTFGLSVAQDVARVGGSVLQAQIGLAAATFQEGTDSGVRPGLQAAANALIPLGRHLRLAPSIGLLGFDRVDGPTQLFGTIQLSLGYANVPDAPNR